MNTKQHFGKAVEAVSPVVATLLLVLVAAGAAIGFGVFLNGFQEKTQDNVKTDAAEQTLRIGGSSTVFEFSKAALDGDQTIGLPAFEAFTGAQGVPMKVELERGGSGAGRLAVGTCLTDIGSSSSQMPATEKAIYPDCTPKDGVQDFGQKMSEFHIGFDGLAMVIKANADLDCSLVDLSYARVAELYRVNGQTATTVLRSVDDTAGNAFPGTDLFGNAVADAAAAAAKYTFANIGCTGTDSTANIGLHDRTDPGGTEEGFCEKVYTPGMTSVKAFDTIDSDSGVAGVQQHASIKDWVACGSDKLLTSAHTAVNGGDGNQGIAAELTDSSLSFIGFGHVQTNPTAFETVQLGSSVANAIQPSVPAVKNGGKGTGTLGTDRYEAVRSLYYYTAGEPSVLEQAWIDFVLNPHYNQLINQKAGYVSFY